MRRSDPISLLMGVLGFTLAVGLAYALFVELPIRINDAGGVKAIASRGLNK